MSNLNWEFFEAYKNLDELCKQVLSSDKGVSEYITQMDSDSRGHRLIACWEMDYKQLKKMRWIRNQLAHEVNSFQNDLITTEDIEWINNFRSRILERTDPFALLHNAENGERQATFKQTVQMEQLNRHFSEPAIKEAMRTGRSSNVNIEKLIVIIAISVCIVALIGGILAIIIFCNLYY